MDPITRLPSPLALLISLLATTTTPAPLSTLTTLTTTTITMPSSTATSYTTVTAPVPTGTAAPEWGQCGGLGYSGPTTCETPFVCACTSAWWCQCQAAAAFALQASAAGAGGPPPVFQPGFITSAYWPTGGVVLATAVPASEPLRAS